MENAVAVFVGELLGTMMLILLGNGVVAGVLLEKSKAQNGGWIVITTGWAFAVLSGASTAAAVSGSMGEMGPTAAINPAVTVGVLMAGGMGPMQAVIEIAGQMVGAILGATLVWLHYMPHWEETEDPGLKLACFSTGPAIRNTTWNLVSEVIGTFVLMFVIFAFGAAAGATPASNLNFYLVGCLVWGIGLGLGGTTGYAINPARDLGPRIAHQLLPIAGKGDSDWDYSWIPVVGPLIGGAIAGLLASALGMV
jgi:glycerol uptake facilitator protein